MMKKQTVTIVTENVEGEVFVKVYADPLVAHGIAKQIEAESPDSAVTIGTYEIQTEAVTR